jgi:hypothetical protein
MRLHVWTWSSGWAEFLCYLYEVFTLSVWTIYTICVKKQNHIYGVHSTRGFDWLHGGGRTRPHAPSC